MLGNQKMSGNLEKITELIEYGNYNDAFDCINELIENTNDINYIALKGFLYAAIEDWQSCINSLAPITHLTEDANLFLILSKAHASLGDLEGSKNQLLIGNLRFPSDELIRKEFEKLEISPLEPSVNILSVQSNPDNTTEIIVEYTSDNPESKINIDIYPVSSPSHPQRHYGYWSFRAGVTFSKKQIKISIDPEGKIVSNDSALIEVDKFIGAYNENNEYKISVNIYNESINLASSSVRIYLGRVYNLKEIEIEKPSLNSAVWFLTWKCNFKCAYCWEVQRIISGELQPEPYKPYKEWVSAWNRLNPKILDISGGEPFLQPGFIDMINELNPSIKLGITTNLSFDLTKFVQEVDPKRFISMTFSLHPTQKMSLDQFIGRVLLLKNRGFGPITINYVTWPEQLWSIERYKKIFEDEIGVRFHVDPYAATPDFPYTFSDEELNYIKKFTGEDRAHFFGGTNDYNVACSGGLNHISVEPDGSAYRCIQDKVTGKPSLGNIFDSSFNLNQKKTFCSDFYQCPGCDRDKVDIVRVDTPFRKIIKIES